MSIAPVLDHPADARVADVLTDANLLFFREQGFLYLEDALPADLQSRLHAEAIELCRGERGELRRGPRQSDGAAAIDGAHRRLSVDEALSRILAVHFPHKLAPAFLEALEAPRVVDGLTRLIGPNVKCMQSMFFVKSAGKPGQAWHQDEYFIPTRDRSLVAAWVALDDATTSNGCLWAIPGSHRRGVLWPQEDHDDPRFDCARESTYFPWSDDDAVPLEVRAGDAILFDGYLLHRSLPNDAQSGYRRALAMHYMSAESLLPWDGPGKVDHIASHDVRDIVMVAGEDPYAWAPLEDVHTAHVRPDGAGGCGNAEFNRDADD